jgi:hypothetical protein
MELMKCVNKMSFPAKNVNIVFLLSRSVNEVHYYRLKENNVLVTFSRKYKV